MKLIQKSLLAASLLTIGTGIVNPVTNVKASNLNYGLTNIGSGIITINVPKAIVYDQNGNATTKALTQGSKWKVDLQNTLNSGSYYRVATNEFIKASDVSLTLQNHLQNQIPLNGILDGVIITSKQAPLYDINGNRLSKSLLQGTSWKVEYQNNLPSGTYYSVATNEYVKASDVRGYQNTRIFPSKDIVTVISKHPALIYDLNGQVVAGRALMTGTKWQSDAYYIIGKAGYYHVGNNEFVSVADVQ
ncbi:MULTISPECIES: SLAP domain-containing protein [unclassified Companilactobacillus]|uniref:SLAP domain-containing protein n=1 Tax=unclassified Companilactobacillus TaxID=2767904 RepID=UPI002FEF0218